MCRVSVTYVMQANQLKELRSFDEDVAFLNYSSCQQTLRRLDKAFQAFFRRVKAGVEAGYPRFKGKGWFKSVCYVYGDGIRLQAGRLYVQHVGLLRIFQHRAIPDDAKIKMGGPQPRVGLQRPPEWRDGCAKIAAFHQGAPFFVQCIGFDLGRQSW